MPFIWQPSTVRWNNNAAEYTGFYKQVARLVRPFVQPHASFCDMGCGLGHVSIALACYVKNITCADNSPLALEALKENADDYGIQNLRVRLADAYEMSGFWNNMFLGFFGYQDLSPFLSQCKRLLVLLGGEGDTPLFPPAYRIQRPKNTLAEVESEIVKMGLPYTLQCAAFEFGQPFASRDDAEAFIRAGCQAIPEAELARFLDENLTAGKGEFPLYLPRMKHVGLFVINTNYSSNERFQRQTHKQ